MLNNHSYQKPSLLVSGESLTLIRAAEANLSYQTAVKDNYQLFPSSQSNYVKYGAEERQLNAKARREKSLKRQTQHCRQTNGVLTIDEFVLREEEIACQHAKSTSMKED